MAELRRRWQGGVRHARAAEALAELQAGMEMYLQFAEHADALGSPAREELEARMAEALAELAQRQNPFQEAGDAASRFVAGLRAALASGRAHVADRQGRAPEEAGAWGWERKGRGKAWRPQGVGIGWVVGSELYLDSVASYRVVQEAAGGAGQGLSEQSLRQRLRGLLASTDTARQLLRVRRVLGGAARPVLHLRAGELFGATALATGRKKCRVCRLFWRRFLWGKR